MELTKEQTEQFTISLDKNKWWLDNGELSPPPVSLVEDKYSKALLQLAHLKLLQRPFDLNADSNIRLLKISLLSQEPVNEWDLKGFTQTDKISLLQLISLQQADENEQQKFLKGFFDSIGTTAEVGGLILPGGWITKLLGLGGLGFKSAEKDLNFHSGINKEMIEKLNADGEFLKSPKILNWFFGEESTIKLNEEAANYVQYKQFSNIQDQLNHITKNKYVFNEGTRQAINSQISSNTKIDTQLKTLAAWRQAQERQEQNLQKFYSDRDTYNNLMEGFGFIDAIGVIAKEPDLQKFATIGKHIVTLGASTLAFAGIISPAILGATGPFGLAALFLSSVTGLSSMARDNKALQKLIPIFMHEFREVKQLIINNQLENRQHFAQLYKNDEILYKAICATQQILVQGFQSLHFSLTAPALQNFAEIRRSLKADFEQLSQKLNYLALQPLTTIVMTARSYLEGTVPKNKLTEHDYIGMMSVLSGYLTMEAKHEVITQMTVLDPHKPQEHTQEFYQAIGSFITAPTELLARLGVLVKYVLSLDDKKTIKLNKKHIFNMAVWRHALETYLKMREAYPGYAYDLDQKELTVVAEQAEQLKKIMDTLRSKEFFEVLFGEFQEAQKDLEKWFNQEIADSSIEFNRLQPEALKTSNQTVSLSINVGEYLDVMRQNGTLPLAANLNPTLSLEWWIIAEKNYCAYSTREQKTRQISSIKITNPLLEARNNVTTIFKNLHDNGRQVPVEYTLLEYLGLGNFSSVFRNSFADITPWSENANIVEYLKKSSGVVRLSFTSAPLHLDSCHFQLRDGNAPAFGLDVKFLIKTNDETLTTIVFEPKNGYLINSTQLDYASEAAYYQSILKFLSNNCEGLSCISFLKLDSSKNVFDKYNQEIRLGYSDGKKYGDELDLIIKNMDTVVLAPKTQTDDLKKARAIIDRHFLKYRTAIANQMFPSMPLSPQWSRLNAAKIAIMAAAVIAGVPSETLEKINKDIISHDEFASLVKHARAQAKIEDPFGISLVDLEPLKAAVIAVLNNSIGLGDYYIAQSQLDITHTSVLLTEHKLTHATDNTSINTKNTQAEQSTSINIPVEAAAEIQALKNEVRSQRTTLEQMAAEQKNTAAQLATLTGLLQQLIKEKNNGQVSGLHQESLDESSNSPQASTWQEKIKLEILEENNKPQTNSAGRVLYFFSRTNTPITSTLLNPIIKQPRLAAKPQSLRPNALVVHAGKQTNFDYIEFNPIIKHDPHTGKPIFTYSFYRNETKVGTMELYDSPIICTDKTGKYNNIISTTRELDIGFTRETDMEEICRALPPSMFDQVILSSFDGAQHGALRGTSKVIAVSFAARGMPKNLSNYLNQFIYMAGFFTLRFHTYLQQTQVQETSEYLAAAYNAALETGQMVLTQWVVNASCYVLKKVSNVLVEKGWKKTGHIIQAVNPIAQRVGIFGWNSWRQGFWTTTASVATGAFVETTLENQVVSRISRPQ